MHGSNAISFQLANLFKTSVKKN